MGLLYLVIFFKFCDLSTKSCRLIVMFYYFCSLYLLIFFKYEDLSNSNFIWTGWKVPLRFDYFVLFYTNYFIFWWWSLALGSRSTKRKLSLIYMFYYFLICCYQCFPLRGSPLLQFAFEYCVARLSVQTRRKLKSLYLRSVSSKSTMQFRMCSQRDTEKTEFGAVPICCPPCIRCVVSPVVSLSVVVAASTGGCTRRDLSWSDPVKTGGARFGLRPWEEPRIQLVNWRSSPSTNGEVGYDLGYDVPR